MPDVSHNTTTPTGHSTWGMSVLDRRLACVGSAQAEAGMADRPGAAAQRGTQLHDIAATALLTGADARDMVELVDDEEGIGLVQPYLDAVRATHARLGGSLHIEQRFHLTSVSDVLWGTSDAVIVAPPSVAVLDLKTGGHRVPITGPGGRVNLQLAGYAMAAIEGLPAGVLVERVEVHVVQPRLNLHLSVDVDTVQLYDLAADLQDAIAASLLPDAPRTPGDHCRYCRAAAVCPALREQVQRLAGGDFDNLASPTEMTTEQVGAVLAQAEMLDVWIGAVRQHARHEADHGRMPAGFKLVERRGRRKWADGAEEMVLEIWRGAHLAEEDAYEPPALRSPAQLEMAARIAKRALPSDAWAACITSTTPGMALVRATDPRPPVTAGPAADFVDYDSDNKEI